MNSVMLIIFIKIKIRKSLQVKSMESSQQVTQFANQNNKKGLFNQRFIQSKRQALKEDHQRRRKIQEQKNGPQPITNDIGNAALFSPKVSLGLGASLNLNNINHGYPPQKKTQQADNYFQQTKLANQFGEVMKEQQQIRKQDEEKKVGLEQILKNGKILKVIEQTLNRDEYKIQCEYEDQTVQLLATKQQISRNNIIPLLDYYERVLSLR